LRPEIGLNTITQALGYRQFDFVADH
jgi:hypothetical protein